MQDLTPSAAKNFWVAVFFLVLSTVAVALRFAVRLVSSLRPLASDWMCALAMPFFYAYCGVMFMFIFEHSRYGAFDLDPSLGYAEMRALNLAMYKIEIIFGFVITTSKLSVLIFYHMIFAIDARVRRGIWVTAAGCVAWWLVATLVVVLQCIPPQVVWEQARHGRCLALPQMLLGIELTNLFLDVVILCIPLVGVGQLQLSGDKKWTVSALFLMGALVCVASIVRLTAIWNPPQVAVNFNHTDTMIWSTVQLGMAIICSCLPTYGPLLTYVSKPFAFLFGSIATHRTRRGTHSSRHQFGEGTTDNTKIRTHKDHSAWEPLGNESAATSLGWSREREGRGDTDSGASSDHALERLPPPPPRGIVVDRNYEVV